MNISLSKKQVLVTGGSKGIGNAIVKALAAAGAKVICHFNTTKPEFDDSEGEIYPVRADLANAAEVTRFGQMVIEKFGTVDVLINNAGIALESAIDSEDDVWLKNWDTTLAVNLRACAQLCKALIPGMQEKGAGIIINVSSRAAHRGDTPDYLAYAASKGGMEALTKSLARGFGKSGIAAFGIAPGFTHTSMAEDFIEKYGLDYAMKDIALDRLTTPEDLAPLIVFLASGLAMHATGTTIDVNAASYVR